MILKRFYNEMLAQASYLVGCAATKEAVVIDANRNLDQYLAAAEAEGLVISAVTETHIHADFASGSRELAARAGATLYLSGLGGTDWQYHIDSINDVHLLNNGDSIRVGQVRLDVIHTPGHTPEHVTFLLVDESVTPFPLAAFTGDFLFIGDVGRPDLLDKVAGYQGTMKAGAEDLFRSLQRFREFPDSLLIFPGHGAGSACGKSLGGVPVSALGYEKAANWAFRTMKRSDFVMEVLQDQPEPPAYFAEMKRINKGGTLSAKGSLLQLQPSELQRSLSGPAWVVDVRPASGFIAGHLPNAISLPYGRSFLTWAGSVLPYGTPLYLIAEHEAAAKQAADALHLLAYDQIAGWISDHSMFETPEISLHKLEQVAPSSVVDEQASGALILDVRTLREFEAGHIKGAKHLPLTSLRQFAPVLPQDTRLIVHCQSGSRSTVASSLLHKLGFKQVVNLTGGFSAYKNPADPERVYPVWPPSPE